MNYTKLFKNYKYYGENVYFLVIVVVVVVGI